MATVYHARGPAHHPLCSTLVTVINTQRDGAIQIVTIDRPETRNAIDGETAAALADAFRRFDANEDASVAVLTGANGTFCSGADLRALEILRVEPPPADGPLGVTRLQLSKPVIAADRGVRRGRRLRGRVVV